MKALHFAKPLEFRLETPAEELVQGESFAGTLAVTNRGGDPARELALDIALAYGQFRQVKAGGAAAFDIVTRHRLADALELAPGATRSAPWAFTLAGDCPITTRDGALFLLYGGNLDAPEGWGHIDLHVRLHPVLETLITTIENQFHFEATLRKNVDGMVEAKFKPPPSYATLQEFFVRMRMDAGVLALLFRFKLKALARGGDKGVKSRWEELPRSLPASEYLIGNTHPNRTALREAVASALGEALPTVFQ
ncbi:MAG: hypothetical protein HY342_05710 [Candidatus Lambdaproteobacteria bacterium]|nr:hypothetical protein [Candidatus Lambdaproteobacteria bacterium]